MLICKCLIIRHRCFQQPVCIEVTIVLRYDLIISQVTRSKVALTQPRWTIQIVNLICYLHTHIHFCIQSVNDLIASIRVYRSTHLCIIFLTTMRECHWVFTTKTSIRDSSVAIAPTYCITTILVIYRISRRHSQCIQNHTIVKGQTIGANYTLSHVIHIAIHTYREAICHLHIHIHTSSHTLVITWSHNTILIQITC